MNNKNTLKRKKTGFTLIEMVAVVAIIGILAAILVPKITGYINEAKKTAVIDQARKVAQAYETAEMKGTTKCTASTDPAGKLGKKTKVGEALDAANGNTTVKSLVDTADLSNLGFENKASGAGDNQASLTIEMCLAITKGSDFTVTKNAAGLEVLNTGSIDLTFASK